MNKVDGTYIGNYYDKYETRNPIARFLMARFLRSVRFFYSQIQPVKVLEVGCGEGLLADHLVRHLPQPNIFEACDLTINQVAPGLDAMINFREASIYELPYEDASFDLVLCCEVMEHLAEPEAGLRELNRVSADAVIVSTPRERLFGEL